MQTIEVSLRALWLYVQDEMQKRRIEEDPKQWLQQNLCNQVFNPNKKPWQMKHVDKKWDITVLGFAISKSQLKRKAVERLLKIRNEIMHRPKFEMSDGELGDKVRRSQHCYSKLLGKEDACRLSTKLKEIRESKNVILCMIAFFIQYYIVNAHLHPTPYTNILQADTYTSML